MTTQQHTFSVLRTQYEEAFPKARSVKAFLQIHTQLQKQDTRHNEVC